MFLSTFEKQLDSKRRIVVPHEFRAAVGQPFEGVFCFPSIEADCLEGGGKALFDLYAGLIEELPFGDPLRSALETSVYGGMAKLSFDEAGRITLPPALCDMFGIAAGAPLLSVERLSYTYGDRPVELRRGLYHTANHHYRNELN